MKKKGFTLIELLAVIVVLAIIALIATPIVMNTIEKSKKGAAERTADNYIDAVEIAAATAKLDGNDILDGEYTIDEDGNLLVPSLPSGKLTVDMNGNKPSGGTITIKDGQVTTKSEMTIGDYDVAYNEDDKKYEATKKNMEVLCKASKSKDATKIYHYEGTTLLVDDVEVGKLASDGNPYDLGVIYSCDLGTAEDSKNLTFFVLSVDGDNVSLIMNKNLINHISWSEDGSNHKDDDESAQAVTAKNALRQGISGWTKLNQNQVKLPTKAQIENTYTDSFPTWLSGNINLTTIYGYWTSTPDTSTSDSAYLFFGERIGAPTVTMPQYSVRPVITISKANLS